MIATQSLSATIQQTIMINTAFIYGIQGIQAGIQRAQSAGNGMANRIDDAAQMAKSAVDQLEARHQVKIGANLVKSADEMIGTLIDITV